MLLPQIQSKNYDFWKLRSKSSKSFIRFKISYVIRMSFACHLYVTCMYSHAICMSLVCTHMPSVCHSYVVLPWTQKMSQLWYMRFWRWNFILELFSFLLALYSYCGDKKQNTDFFQIIYFKERKNMTIETSM